MRSHGAIWAFQRKYGPQRGFPPISARPLVRSLALPWPPPFTIVVWVRQIPITATTACTPCLAQSCDRVKPERRAISSASTQAWPARCSGMELVLPSANPLAVGETRSRCGTRLPACLYHRSFPCSIPLLLLSLRTPSQSTGPSNTFVIRQSQRLNVFTTNDLNYPTRPVIIALAHRQSTSTLPPPISSYSFPTCSWTVSVSCRLSHSSLFGLVRLSVYASREAICRITLSNNAGNFVLDHRIKHFDHFQHTSPCLPSEASQPPSRSRPSVPTRRTRRGMLIHPHVSPSINTDTSQSIHCRISPQ
jgi:hypothetical protein